MIVTKNKNDVHIRLKQFEWIKLKYIFENFNIQYKEIKEYQDKQAEIIKWRFNNG